jgi:hypothetical protein
MDPTDTKNLIDAAGGDIAFARILGLEVRDGLAQRINNWKRRGMPAAVCLAHYDTINRLKAEALAPKRRRA